MESHLDYRGGPSNHKGLSKREAGGSEVEKLKLHCCWKEATSQGMKAVSRSWKKQGTDSPLELPKGTQPCWPLDFSHRRLIFGLLTHGSCVCGIYVNGQRGSKNKETENFKYLMQLLWRELTGVRGSRGCVYMVIWKVLLRRWHLHGDAKTGKGLRAVELGMGWGE